MKEEIHNLAREVYKSQDRFDKFKTGCVYGELKWNTGEPTEFGEYLTTRETNLGGVGRRYVSINQWATKECCNYPPKTEGWQIGVADGSRVIGWVKIDSIKPMK